MIRTNSYFVLKKLKASTILEPIMASVILTIGVSVFSLSLGNTIKMGNAGQQLNMQGSMQEIITHTIKENRLIDEGFQLENFTMEKTVYKYNEKENLFVIAIKTFNNEHEPVSETRQIVRMKIDE